MNELELKANKTVAAVRENEIMLKQAIVDHFDYTDPSQKTGTSKGGFMVSINKQIKAAFGESREGFTIEQWALLNSALSGIQEIIKNGEKNGELRKNIKVKIREYISKYAGMMI